MNNYCMPKSNRTNCIFLSETDFLDIYGVPPCSEYAGKLYYNKITIEDVPEDYRADVLKIVKRRIDMWGECENLSASFTEIRTYAENLVYSGLTRGTAKLLFSDIEKLRSGATDAVASTAVSVFPRLKEDSSLVSAGTRINWNGTLKRAAVDLWDTAENNPDNAPDLWEDISYREGHRIIPETITAGTAFAMDEYGWWGDTLYRSKLAANTYTPKQYPDGWEAVIT